MTLILHLTHSVLKKDAESVCLGCVWLCGSVCSVIKRRREGSQIREQSAKPKSRVYHVHHYSTVLHMQICKCNCNCNVATKYQLVPLFFPLFNFFLLSLSLSFSKTFFFFSSLHIKYKLHRDCIPTHLFFYCIFNPQKKISHRFLNLFAKYDIKDIIFLLFLY